MFKNRKLIFLSALLLLIVLIGSASAAEVNDIQQVTQDSAGEIITDEVSSAGIDDNSGLEELENSLNTDNDLLSSNDQDVLGDTIDFSGTTFSELQTKINNCHEGDIINLHDNVIQTGSSEITINKPLTINGNGYTIDAQGKSGIFNITSDYVTLNNIALINGNITHSTTPSSDAYNSGIRGGAIIWSGANGTVSNCNFTNNTANHAGAIYWTGANGTVSNCNFTNNTAKASGGAILWSGANGNISNSNFINNTLQGSDSLKSGGAIYYSGYEGTVSNCNFTNNNCTYGGAIYYAGANGNISYCNFNNNTGDGKAISLSGANGNISNCNFTNHTETGDVIEIIGVNETVFNCDFTNNRGGIFFVSGHGHNGTVSYCNFTNSQYTGVTVHYSENCSVSHCNFINNNGSDLIYWAGSNGNTSYCTFINNTVGQSGAVHGDLKDINGTVSHCYFANNTAVFSYSLGASAIFWAVGTLNVSDSYFIDNKANANSLVGSLEDSQLILTFNGSENYINAIYGKDVSFSNVTYWNGSVVNSDDVAPQKSNQEVGINITLEIYNDEDTLIDNVTLVTDENGQVFYDFSALDYSKCYYKAYHMDDRYYTYVEKIGTLAKTELAINKTANASVVEKDSLVNFTIEISNIGEGSAFEIYITDTLTYGLQFVEASEGWTNSSGSISWIIDKLPASKSISVWIVANATRYGPLENTAYARFEQMKEGDYINDSATVTVEIPLTINKTVNDSVVVKDSLVNFTIEINNTGKTDMTGIMFYDRIPEGLVFVKASEGLTWEDEHKYLIGEINLPAGQGISLWVVVNATDYGPHENIAVAYFGNGNYIYDNATVTVSKAPSSVTVDKIINYTGAVVSVIANVTDANGNPITGGTVTFIIHYDTLIESGLLGANVAEYTANVDGGKAVLEGITLGAPGKYLSTIEYSGTDNYESSSSRSEVEILSLNTTVKSDDISGNSGEKTDIVAEIVDQNNKPVQNGTAVLKVNGKEYTSEVKDGKATFKDVELPSEDTEATIEYLGNDYYNPSNATVQITINEEPQPEPDDGNETEPDTTPEESGESEGSQTAAMEKTGNPLFLLIVAVLACLPILRRKQ